MLRFATLFALIVCVTIGVSMVPAAHADENHIPSWVRVQNLTDLTVHVWGNGQDLGTCGPHSLIEFNVEVGENRTINLHAVSQDNSRSWDEKLSFPRFS
jgi:hypothetical protein